MGWRQGKVREMSGNFVLPSLYEPCIYMSASGVVLGGVAEVVGSNLARGKIFTASIGSVDSLYPSVYIYIYIYRTLLKAKLHNLKKCEPLMVYRF